MNSAAATDAKTHTPGPWGSDRRGSHGVANYTVISATTSWHNEIARVYHGNRFADGDANARLIAAAPDMLEVLKAIKGCPQAAVALARLPFGEAETHETSVFDALCTVITKARGHS